ncbi:uncharacterized protein N7498_000343 [Penicillium cinerascens]|uniref:Uncharacterized protein n=1 Tax=Penicillium cinerascens TaxID=70096 RepID=A0A9W9NGE2_9EURO|nr:uncharacterized protein N7498_000343 [Penicillium cinerascens]KAJ5218244.1 hypothetical protein N7498_000343 [Penicillium cinerascens]
MPSSPHFWNLKKFGPRKPEPQLLLQPPNQESLKSGISPELQPYLDHLSTRLQPLVSCIEGRAHPDFPNTLLQYHLLTATQLDNLACHYHQISPPVPESACYPIQRRRFGRFIGLQGCESPVEAQGMPWVYDPTLDHSESFLDEGVIDPPLMAKTEAVDQMLERMEREWEEALALAQEDENRLGLFLGYK